MDVWRWEVKMTKKAWPYLKIKMLKMLEGQKFTRYFAYPFPTNWSFLLTLSENGNTQISRPAELFFRNFTHDCSFLLNDRFLERNATPSQKCLRSDNFSKKDLNCGQKTHLFVVFRWDIAMFERRMHFSPGNLLLNAEFQTKVSFCEKSPTDIDREHDICEMWVPYS